MATDKKKFVYLEKFERTKEAIKLEFKNINFQVSNNKKEIERLSQSNVDITKELKKMKKDKLISDFVLIFATLLTLSSIVFTFNLLNTL